MDQADDELRVTIQHIWPLQAKKMLDLLIPRNNCLNSGKLTVGKIYAGLLILESWRNTRFGQIDSGLPVSLLLRVLVTYLTAPLNIYICIYIHHPILESISYLHVVFSLIDLNILLNILSMAVTKVKLGKPNHTSSLSINSQ